MDWRVCLDTFLYPETNVIRSSSIHNASTGRKSESIERPENPRKKKKNTHPTTTKPREKGN